MMYSMRLVVAAGLAMGTGLACAQAPSEPAPVQPAPALGAAAGFANREALAWWYLEVDRAWEAVRASKDAAGLRAAHEAFDTATLSFFKLDMAGAVKQLARLRCTLQTGTADPSVLPISLEVEPRVWVPPAAAPAIRLLGTDGAAGTVDLVIQAATEAGQVLVRREFKADRAALSRGQVQDLGIDWSVLRDRMERTGNAEASGRTPLVVQWTLMQGTQIVGADRLIISPWSLAQRKTDLLARIDAIEPKGSATESDVRMARSRASLLTDAPSRNKASEFLADYASLPNSLDRELTQLEQGTSPYPLEGAWWTTVRAGKVTTPLWFSAPAERRSGRPLLVVFHGAGGDESMFIYGYGQGSLVREAVKRGMVVASPATGATMGSPRVFEAIVSEAQRLYGTDPSRVSIAGHSMGGGAVSSLAQRYPTRLAGAVCFAGGNFDASRPICPTLMLGGEIDPIIPGPRLGVGAQRCIDAGLPLTFTLCPGTGHTFIVGDHAIAALDFVGDRRSEVPFTSEEKAK